MTNTLKTISKISSVVALTLLLCSSVSASEIDMNGSMYKYNVIENDSINPNKMVINTGTLPVIENTSFAVDIQTKLNNISDKQKFSTEEINKSMDEIESSSDVKIFLVGNNLGVMKFQLVQINNYIFELNDLIQMAKDGPDAIQKEIINNQIETLKEEQTRVENFISMQDHRFSLFGWLVTSL